MPTDADGDGVADLFGAQPGAGGEVGGGIGAGRLRFTEMAAGYYSTCGLLPDGELRCFGASTYGEATPPVGPDRHGLPLLVRSAPHGPRGLLGWCGRGIPRGSAAGGLRARGRR